MDIFGNFCSDNLWDLNQTWNNEVPDFSACFQDIVLTSVPSFVFFCIFLINIFKMQAPLSRGPLPWSWLNITKTVLSITLLLICIAWCGVTIQDNISGNRNAYASLLSSSTKIILFISTTVLLLQHRRCGVTTSYLLSIFWLLFSLCSIILQRSVILSYFEIVPQPTSDVIFILSMLYYPIIYFQLFLTIFTEEQNLERLQDSKLIGDISFFSFITFSWFNRYVYKSTKRLLTVCDFGFLSIKFIASYLYKIFAKNWNFQTFPVTLKSRSLAFTLIKSFWIWIVVAIACDISYVIVNLIPPLLVDRIIDFVQHDKYAWRGYFYVGIVFVVDFLGKILQSNSMFAYFCSSAQIKSALMSSVYRKNLLLSTASRKEYPSGIISNLLSVDIQRLTFFTWHCSVFITAPLRIIFVLIIMWHYLGPATLVGVVIVLLLFPLNLYIARLSDKYTEKQMKVKDTRLKYLNEILSGIKILKLYAWELAFSSKLTKTRKEELKLILYSQMCFVATMFLNSCVPLLISTCSFAIFLLVEKDNVLTPTRAFVSISLMEQLKWSLFQIPDAIAELIQCNIALGRLKKFFTADNSDSMTVGNNPNEDEVVTIKNGSFLWDTNAGSTLKDIDLGVRKGKLIAIIGPVGSGKSSLLSAILGEIHKTSGCVDVKGSLAYVPQQAWILNQTVKENILMMKHLAGEKYNQILDLCCLRPDLEILPAGDETEIGEKGVNLSGGQKQRISLARAVYQDKEIYLLDDTLSAVDVHVRKALFDDIIGNEGLLKKKTRILVTHDVSVLHKVDVIVSMKDGSINEIGTYQDLMKSDKSFTNFIKDHTSQKHLDEYTEENKRFLSRSMSVHSAASHHSGASGEYERGKNTNDFYEDKTYRLIEDEKMEIGTVNRRVYWNYIKTVGMPLSVLALIGFLAVAASETSKNIWLSKWSGDSSLNGTQSTSRTYWRISIYAALGFSQGLSMTIGGIAIIYGTLRASGIYHRKMLNSVLKSPMSFFDCTPIGRITNRFTSDLDILDTELAIVIFGCFDFLFFFIGAFYVIGTNAPIFLAIIVPLGIVYYVLQKLYLNIFRQIRRLESTTKSPLYSQLLESIQGVSSICAYKVQDEFIVRFEEKVDNHILCYLNSKACSRWINFLLDLIGSIVVLIATYLTIEERHNLTPAEVGLMMSYALSMTNDLKWFVQMNTELEDKSISVERVSEYCQLESEASWICPHENIPNDWPSVGSILFKNYSTKYREDLDLVLTDINLSITGSEKVGIVGRTGAGKSSVTMALFRVIEPVSGTIVIDDVDIKEIGLHTLRSKLTIIPQDPVLFTGTLRSNLDPNNECNDELLWKSLEQSHLKEFVKSLEKGLEHNVEEGGANLSAGQKQLVCLARALLKKTKILILDEATASVDMETDNLIQNTIRNSFSRHTVITIAHRLNTILDYDKIVVLENGSIVEVGNPVNLLKDTTTRFYEMARDAGLI